ncbi:MAG TPA: sulfatase-like hydrolase/transferase [Labilithrix sp.]|jgi:hypothetical protein
MRARLVTYGSIAAALVFALQFVLMSVVFGAHVQPASAAASGALWALGVALSSRSRVAHGIFAAAAAALAVVQVHVFRYYHAPLDVQVAASAIHAWHDVRAVLARALGAVALASAAAFAIEYALLAAAKRAIARPWPAALSLACVGAIALVAVRPREATPDIRGIHALRALTDRREAPSASAIALPPLHADRDELPSILLVLTESVRASDYDDATAPARLGAVGRGRVDLREMRSVSSYTAVSLSAILTGRSQEGAREDVLRAPSLFDFAHAARDARGRRPTIAYVSAQSAEVFESKDVRAAVDRFVTIETFTGKGEVPDDQSADYWVFRWASEHLAEIPSPRIVVLHLIDTHAPYWLDDDDAPFRPYDHVVAWSRMDALHNAYKDAIYTQDRRLARAVNAFVAQEHGPWMVVFTSDHGEAFGDHGAIHHGQNLFDEQVHVPAWIASSGSSDALVANADRFTTHLDLLPTMLDALGLWDNFAVAPYRATMRGRSLLRPWEPRGPIPVTNCTGMFPCPLNTWGVYEDDRKLVARIYDGGWTCLALDDRREREADPDDPACARLRDVSKRTFPLLPNGQPNR